MPKHLISRAGISQSKAAVVAVALFGIAACDSATVAGSTGTDSTEVVVALSDMPVNIGETAVGAGVFDTLVATLHVTGLDTVFVDANASFTVFAPTDAAFAALGSETVDGQPRLKL